MQGRNVPSSISWNLSALLRPAGWRRVMTTEMLYQRLRGRIQDGTYPMNEALPTEAALQEEFKAARGTVRAALQRLVDDGLVFLGEGRKRLVQRAASLRNTKIRIASRSPSLTEYIQSLPGKPRDEV